MFKSLVLAAALLVPVTAFAQPQTVIRFDIGGWIPDYHERAQKWSNEGRRIVIDGECRSSCTIYLFSAYNLDLCMTPRAKFRFHMPFWRTGPGRHDIETGAYRVNWSSKRWSAEYLAGYPKKLAVKVRNAPNPSKVKDARAYLTLTASQMKGIVPPC